MHSFVTIHELVDATLFSAFPVFEHVIEAVEDAFLGHRNFLKIHDDATSHFLGNVSTIEDIVLRGKGGKHDEGPLLFREIFAFHANPEVTVLESAKTQELFDKDDHGRWLRAILESDDILVWHINNPLQYATQVVGCHKCTCLLGQIHAVATHNLIHLVLTTRHGKGLRDGYCMSLGYRHLFFERLLHLGLLYFELLNRILQHEKDFNNYYGVTLSDFYTVFIKTLQFDWLTFQILGQGFSIDFLLNQSLGCSPEASLESDEAFTISSTSASLIFS